MTERPTPDWQLVEVDCGSPAPRHLPGAIRLDINLLEQRPYWNRVDDAALLQVLLDHGVHHRQSVILYSRTMTAAARVGQLLLVAGVQDVRLLDGNLASWCASGLPLASGTPRAPVPARDFGTPCPLHPELLIDMAQARALLQQADGTLASIRSHAEFIGATSGYSYIDACGELPGACWGRAGIAGDVNSMSDYQHPDGRMKDAAVIRAFWAESGIVRSKQTAFYCGTGWRASLAFFYARAMGWPRISVFDGGWFEWSSAPAHPWSTLLPADAARTMRTHDNI